MEQGLMNLNSNENYEVFDLKLNCHICGKSFSPLRSLITPTDRREYVLGTYCRLVIYRLADESIPLLCEHQKPVGLTWMYDKKDNMENRKLTSEELGELNNG